MDHEVDYIISITILAQALAGNGRLCFTIYSRRSINILLFLSKPTVIPLQDDVYKHYDGTRKAKKKYLVVTQL